MSLLFLEDVSVDYSGVSGGDRKLGLFDLSLQLDSMKYGLIGLNGSGKSTLFRVIAGVVKPDGGWVKWSRNDVRLSYVMQNSDHQLLMPTAREELAFSLSKLKLQKEEESKIIEKFADKFLIADFLDKPIYQLSEGQKKLLALVDAMIVEPDVILCDEIFNNLDIVATKNILSIVHSLRCCVLLATHNLSLIRNFDSCIWLERGRKKAFGDTGQICQQYLSDYEG